ncbi:RNA-dependent DNA polymerase, putative [Ruegeria pomeroyi DSS-3]|jgi:hypothetical protein|uniref:RNA-directed DNA polymerase n=2 Tax=Ruegeria pomeroyi TaxID=89184 RepID=Q5LUK7_RUEPO|nr:reverse transcriptase family protein [Ruegeria pomeroyi]AAV97130.1 RNA-dependent DNA polymerase, putative [Ruegeria pomeroyi DSS-3]NVK97499.1 RNA-directed DNA polymerase [Ruegeria pomeroyi]HCE70084.1 RNA-directed DNA polymerase [Ruegeria sp.]
MRLPHQLTGSRFFSFSDEGEFLKSVSAVVDEEEFVRIGSLVQAGLMPITSKEVLATMLGVNPGIIWSLENKPERYYRRFKIPKGKGEREIVAPKVGLKVIQKWFSVQLQDCARIDDHVFGFVPGRSHIDAASVHTNANWVYSIDLTNFFPSTPINWVASSLINIGYDADSADRISKLCCYRGALAQGSPASPVLSNISMRGIDAALGALAAEMDVRVTRYADDITFSAAGEFPQVLPERLESLFSQTPWKISQEKTYFSEAPVRLKVHGLVVNGNTVKLTKGYRNKLRAYRHVLQTNRCRQEDLARLSGHVRYASQVSSRDD